jgi:hypothetical protein
MVLTDDELAVESDLLTAAGLDVYRREGTHFITTDIAALGEKDAPFLPLPPRALRRDRRTQLCLLRRLRYEAHPGLLRLLQETGHPQGSNPPTDSVSQL